MDKVNLKTLSVKKSVVSKVSNEREAQKARLKNNRDQKRSTTFFAARGLDVEEETARKTRAQKLEEFRKQKLIKKQEEQKKKLPPFRAGIVRHALNSPYKFEVKDKDVPSTKASNPSMKTFNFTMNPKVNKTGLKITIPQSPKFSALTRHRHCMDTAVPPQVVHLPQGGNQTGMTTERKGVMNKNETTRRERNEIIMNKNNETRRKEKDDKVVNKNEPKQERNQIIMDKTNETRRKIETDFEVKKKNERELEKDCNDEDVKNNAIEIPEFFVRGSGGSSKQNLRKSSLLTPIKAPVATTPTNLTGVEYQRHRIHEERNLLHKYCYRWYDILNDANQNIPSDIRDEIDCIIGQTKLLTSDKFQQMSNLVDQFENQSCSDQVTNGTVPAATVGEPRILENDLDSFWDMIYIQVDLMYKKFDRLKRLESDNWIDKEEEAKKLAAATKKADAATRKASAAVKKPPGGVSKAVAAGGKSRLADFIRNKRAQAAHAQSGETIVNAEQKEEEKSEMETDETKLFTGIFFKIESPVSKTRSKASPKFTPHVQKSILKNKMSAINMIAVSPLAKSLASTSLVDVISTPSDEMKSILKKKTDNTVGLKPKPFTPGGKKICFSLNEPSTDDEVFLTPRETPQKRIRKTPHKPQQTFSPGQEEDLEEPFSPDLNKDQGFIDQTQNDQDMIDIEETNQNDDNNTINETFSVTLCEPTTIELENDASLPSRQLRSTRGSSRRDASDLSSVLQSISLNTIRNDVSEQKSRNNSNVAQQKTGPARRKSGKITFEENSSSDDETVTKMEFEIQQEKKLSLKKQLRIQNRSETSVKITFEDGSPCSPSDSKSINNDDQSEAQQMENSSPKYSYGQKSAGRKSARKSMKITFDDSFSERETAKVESETQQQLGEEHSSPKKRVQVEQNRYVQFLAVPDSRQSSPMPESPENIVFLPRKSPRVSRQPVRYSPGDVFLPRKSPRVSRQPLRYSPGDRNNNTPSRSKKLSNKSKTENRIKTPRSESNENRIKTPRSESNENRNENLIGSELKKNRMGSESKENRTPNVRTPRKSSITPSKGSASKGTSSTKSNKKFVLRPSRLAI